MFRWFKFLKALLIVSAFSVCAQARTHSLSPFDPGGDNGGGSHPWPWGLEVPFPWEDIQGIWKLHKSGKSYYFSFRRLQSKRLALNLFDLDACMITGGGAGYEKQKTVVAQINEFSTHKVYRVTLYAFNPEDSPEPPATQFGQFDPGHVMVVRINSMSFPGPEVAYQMVKITDRLEIRCNGQNKFLRF